MKTTKITFQHISSPDVDVYYYDEKKCVLIKKKESDIKGEIVLDYDEIKRINRAINENLK